MPRSVTATVQAPRPVAPGSIVVVPPLDIAADELRLARLGGYLRAEFPDLDFTIAERLTDASPAGLVGIAKADDGSAALPADETREVVGAVIEAVTLFLNYGERRH